MDTENKSGNFFGSQSVIGVSPQDVSNASPTSAKSFLLDVTIGGLQEILLSYANGHAEPILTTISVNGIALENASLASTGSWSTFANHAAFVDLPEGVHVLTFSSHNQAGAEVATVTNMGPASGGRSSRSFLTGISMAGLNVAAVGAVALTMSAGVHQANEQLGSQPAPQPDGDGPAVAHPQVSMLSGAGITTPINGAAQSSTEAPGMEDQVVELTEQSGSEYSGEAEGSVDAGAPVGHFYNLSGSDDAGVPAFVHNIVSNSGGTATSFALPSQPVPLDLSIPASSGAVVQQVNVTPPTGGVDGKDDDDNQSPPDTQTPPTGTGTGVTPEPNTPSPAQLPIRIQAEAATLGAANGNILTPPVIVNLQNAGASDIPHAQAADGNAYVDFTGFNNNTNIGSGQYIEWSFEVPEAGFYDIDVGYAFVSSGVKNRPMRLDVNGELWDRVFDFPSTGANDVYRESSTRVYLNAGENTIRLTANGFSGPNIDYLDVRPADPNVVVIQAEDLVSQQGNNTNGAVNRPITPSSTPSNEVFRFGAEGEAYLDWAVNAVVSLSIPVTVAVAGTYSFAVTYVNGTATARPLQLFHGTVDGQPVATLNFVSTTPNALTALPSDLADLGSTPVTNGTSSGIGQGWEGWTVETVTIHLEAGVNNLILSGTNVTTGPNIDKFVISLIEADVIVPENVAPEAASATLTVAEDNSLTIDLSNYVSDAEDALADLIIDASVPVEQGVVTVSGHQIIFTPAQDFYGQATISYSVTDTGGKASSASFTIDVTSVNDAPVLTGSVEPHNLATGSEHHIDLPLNAMDVDGDPLSLIIGNSGDLPSGFSIVDGRLVIADTVAAATYQIAIVANDGSLNSAPIQLTVTLTAPIVDPVNAAPVIVSEPVFSVNENSLLVGEVVANDVDGDTLTYELQGPDSALFTVSADGVISFVAAPDYENPADADHDGVYSLTLQVSDGKTVTTQELSVVVDNVNEAPSVPVFNGSMMLSDAASAGHILGVVAATDPDGDAIAYSVSDARFAVNSNGQLVVADGAQFDFAAEPSISLVITAGDGTLSSTTTLNLSILESDDTHVVPVDPADPNAQQGLVFDPNGLTPYSTQDSGPGGSITNDGATVLLDGNFWKRAALPESFTITENTKLTVTVTIGSVLPEIVAIGFDDDEDPFELTDRSIYQIAGNQKQSAFVDLRGDQIGTPGQVITLTIDLSAHAGKTISSLVFIADDDAPSNGIGSVSFSSMNLFNVVPDNHDPFVIGGGFTNMAVNERAALEVDLPFVDGDGDTLTYVLSVKDGDGNDVAGFDGLSFVDGALVGAVNALPGAYTVTVTASDGRGGAASSSFTLTVNNINDAPGADTSIQYEPLQSTIGESVELSLEDFRDAFSDIDGDHLTLSVEGLPAGLTVNEYGMIVGTPTATGDGFITITATDPGGLSASIQIPYYIEEQLSAPKSFTIEAEHFTGLASAIGFYASAAVEASGGQIIRTDADVAASVTTTLSQNGIVPGWYRVSITVFDESDGTAHFSLKVGDTILADNLTFDDNGTFDHGSSPRGTAAQKGNLKTISFDTTVYIDANTIAQLTGQSDSGELLRIDRLTLTQAEGPSQLPPSAVSLSSSSIHENVAGGLIGTLSAQDPDGDSAAIVYSTNDSRFVIVGNQLSLADGVSFDHEIDAATSVVVIATDAQGKTSTTELVITIADVNEAPELAANVNIADLAITTGQTSSIDLTAALAATDPDQGDAISYVATLADGSPLLTGITVANGVLNLDGTLLAGNYTISVKATDGALYSEAVNFNLSVTARPALTPITLQAEDANVVVLDTDANTNDTTIRNAQNPEQTTGLINGLRPDFSGTGYVDFGDFPGDSIIFTVTVDQAGAYDLNVRYASQGSRPLSLSVNNGANSTMGFGDTGIAAQGGQPAVEAFNNWAFSTVAVTLVAGTNIIKLAIPANATTGPNIDRIEITEYGTGPIPVDTSADADDIPLFLRGPQDPLSGAGAESINFNLAGIDQDIVKVEMSFDGGLTRVVVHPDADGDYVVTGHALTAGVHTAIAYVTDAAGNIAQSQTQFTIVTTVPIEIAPFTIQAEDATQVDINDSGTGNSDTTLTRAVTQAVPDAYGNYRPGAVGNSYVDFGENVGDAITVNVNAPAAGTYVVTIRYANGGTADRPLSLILNGAHSDTVSFVPGAVVGTGSTATAWNSWLDKTIEVTLVEGQNTLRFEMPAGAIGGPNLDQFTFAYQAEEPGVIVPQPFFLKIEAETFTISDVEANGSTPADTVHRTAANKEPGATAANSGPNLTFDSNGLRGNHEGTGYLDMGNDIGDKASFNVSVEQAGIYQLTIRYANGGAENRPMSLDVGGVAQTIDFPVTTPTGGTADNGWSTWKVVTVDIHLQAGTNTISLANTITNGPNIDNVTISRDAVSEPVDTRELIRFEPVVKINFEPAQGQSSNGLPTGYQTPTGYLADTGAAFGDRGNGFSYGWVTEASVADGTANGTIAAAQPANAHWYKNTVDGASNLQKTYAHFEYPGASGDNARAWEMALENGTYQVTMSIGDTAGAFDSSYVINLEGVNVMPTWVPANPQDNNQNGGGFRSTLVTTTVTVTDGRLTLDSIGGINTEIQYLEIERVPDLTPNDGRSADLDFSLFVNPVANSQEGGRVSIAIGENGSLPIGIDPTSTFVVGVQLQADGNRGPNIAYTNNIKLVETLTGIEVPIAVQISGGADTLNVRPLQNLKEFTSYTLKVQDVMDLGSIDNPNGALKQFQDLTTTFVTGETPVDVPREVAFSTDLLLNGTADGAGGFTSIEFGPDGKLYIATITGQIHRWTVNDDGTIDKASLETLNLDYLSAPAGERRGIVGLVFDPEDPYTIWISDSAPIPREAKAFNTPEFSGRVSKITLGEGGAFETATAEAYITGLPRSGGDHLTNSLEFRPNPDYTSDNGEPEYLLYVSQGSNTAAGAADSAWGNRPERLLNAAILEIDPTRTPPNGGFNVQTEPSSNDPSYQAAAGNFNADGTYTGYYNPFDTDAVLKIFATGVRNAYDLVWHSNGQLYVPTNGTASGGKTPTDPNQPGLDTTISNSPTQKDYFFIVDEGGYYGHPNPLRGEYILNGGNPTGGKDPHEVVGGNDGNGSTDGYQTGVQTDPDYDLDGVYDLGYNRSPNGAIEYTGNAFGSNLKGAVLFAQFSTGDNIRYMLIGADGKVIGDEVLRRPDGSVINNYIDPLDIIQNPITGQLYLMTLNRSTGASQLVLLTPAPGGVTQDLTADVGNDLAIVALDVSHPELAKFRVDGLDNDITTIKVSVDGGPKTVITLNAQKQFTFDLGDVSGPVSISLEVTDAKLNSKTVSVNVVAGEVPQPEEFILLTTIQAEDKTPNDGTSVVVATGSTAQIQIRDASNPEAASTVGTVNGLRPGAYGVDGNTDSTDGVSGGYADFGSTNADFITFNFEVGADQAGASVLRFRYANGATTDRPLQLEVNGTIIGVQSFLPATVTGGADPWNVWQTVEIPVVLKAGTNAVTLRSVQNTGPNIDQLEVLVAKPVPTVPNDGEVVVNGVTYVKYEAEHAELGGAAVVTENRNQSGSFVDYVGTSDQSVSWTISTAASGTYGLDVIYALGAGKAARPMTLSVNGVVVQTLNFTANSNAGENIWAPLQTTLDLTAGTNVITLTAPVANGPNLDFIRVTKDAVTTFVVDHAEIDGTGRIELEATDGSAHTVNGSTVEFYFNVADSGTYKLDVAANPGASNGQSLKWYLNGVEVDISAFPGAGTQGEESIYVPLVAGQDYQLKIVSNAPGASALDYLDIQPAPGNPNVDIHIQSLDAAYFDDRLHFSYLENPKGVSQTAREFKDEGTVRISNTGSEPLEIEGYQLTGPFSLKNAAALTNVVIAPGSYLDVTVVFNRAAYSPPTSNVDGTSTIFEGQLKLISNDQDTPISTVKLAGFWQARDEGGQEPNVNEVWKVFGFGNVIEALKLTNGGESSTLSTKDVFAKTDETEVLSPYWKLADGVTEAKITQIAAFHGLGGATLSIHAPSNTGQSVQFWNHYGNDNQTLLPNDFNNVAFATKTFTRADVPDGWVGNDIFGIAVAGLSTDPRLNPTGSQIVPGAQQGHTVKIFQALDANGNVIPNVYLGIMDYTGINYDYNDNMFVIEGVQPVGFGADMAISGLDDAAADDRLVFTTIDQPANAQQVFRNEATFTIKNDGAATLTLSSLVLSDTSAFEFVGAVPTSIAVGGSAQVTIRFKGEHPGSNAGAELYKATLTINSNDFSGPKVVHLAGLAQEYSENGSEPTVSQIVEAFGYSTNMAEHQLANGGKVEAVGDEVLMPYLEKLDGTKSIEVIQIAAFLNQGNVARLGFHNLNSSGVTNLFANDDQQGQTVLPDQLVTGSGSGANVARGVINQNAPFGIFISVDGRPTYSSWSDPEANKIDPNFGHLVGNEQGHLIRFFEALDANGNVIAGTYIAIQDYPGAGNYDYNDHMFIITNVKPHVLTPANDANGDGINDALQLDGDLDGLVDFFDNVTPPSNSSQTPYGGTAPSFTNGTLVVDATNFDNGGQGVSWDDNPGLDNPTGNPAFRPGRDVELVGTGLDIGHVKPGEWVEYTINVPFAGIYKLTANAKTPVTGATIAVSLDGQTLLGTVALTDSDATGSNFNNASFGNSAPISVALPAGIQTIRLTFDGPLASNGYVLDLASFTLTAPELQTPYSGTAPSFTNGTLVVDATNFDNGGQGISWNDNAGLDNPTSNPTFRPDRDVELVGTGLDIGHVKPGEWVEYTINVPSAGTYLISANAKTPVTGATIAVSLDGNALLGTISLTDSDPTGSNFNNASFGNSAPIAVSLPAGIQTLRLTFDGPLASNGYILDLASFTLTATQGQVPFGGEAPVLGGDGLIVLGVEYDEGGQGVAYNDAPGLSGGTNGGRSGSAVEVTSGGAIGWIGNGEWLEYTVNVAEAGRYDLNLSMAMVENGQGARSVTATFTNGSSVTTTTISTPNTNNWLLFQDTETKSVELAEGETVIRLTFHGDSQDLKSFSLQPSQQGVMAALSIDGDQDAAILMFDLEHSASVDDTPTLIPDPDPLQGYDLLV